MPDRLAMKIGSQVAYCFYKLIAILIAVFVPVFISEPACSVMSMMLYASAIFRSWDFTDFYKFAKEKTKGLGDTWQGFARSRHRQHRIYIRELYAFGDIWPNYEN